MSSKQSTPKKGQASHATHQQHNNNAAPPRAQPQAHPHHTPKRNISSAPPAQHQTSKSVSGDHDAETVRAPKRAKKPLKQAHPHVLAAQAAAPSLSAPPMSAPKAANSTAQAVARVPTLLGYMAVQRPLRLDNGGNNPIRTSKAGYHSSAPTQRRGAGKPRRRTPASAAAAGGALQVISPPNDTTPITTTGLEHVVEPPASRPTSSSSARSAAAAHHHHDHPVGGGFVTNTTTNALAVDEDSTTRAVQQLRNMPAEYNFEGRPAEAPQRQRSTPTPKVADPKFRINPSERRKWLGLQDFVPKINWEDERQAMVIRERMNTRHMRHHRNARRRRNHGTARFITSHQLVDAKATQPQPTAAAVVAPLRLDENNQAFRDTMGAKYVTLMADLRAVELNNNTTKTSPIMKAMVAGVASGHTPFLSATPSPATTPQIKSKSALNTPKSSSSVAMQGDYQMPVLHLNSTTM